MDNILYTGASNTSLVGSRVVELLGGNAPSHKDFDILDTSTFSKFNPKILIHFAAATKVDACEANPEDTYTLNVVGTKNIVDYFGKKGTKIIYISTDYVFDGVNGPYNEEDAPNPINVYGKTKLEGENYVLSHCNNAVILRIAFPYRLSGEKSDTLRWIISSIIDKKEISVFDNLKANFTFIDDIAKALQIIIEKDFKGVIHVTGDEIETVYDTANRVLKFLGSEYSPYVKAKEFISSNTIAKRPLNGGLISKYKDKLGIKMTPIDENIRKIIDALK